MDVPRVPPVSPLEPGTPAAGDHQGAGGELPFEAGQRLFARVLQAMSDGRVLLELAGQRLLASTPVPVREGDVLAVVVRGLGPVVELDVEAPPLAFSERAYALAAVRQALQQARPVAPLTTPEIEALARALEGANWGAGAPGASSRDRLLALVRPIPLSGDAATIVDALRDRLAHGGLAFEAHAAKAAARPPGTVPADLQADVRWLLTALAREMELPPEVEWLRQRLVDDIARRQLDVAHGRLRDGETRVDVPLLFGSQDAPTRLTIGDAPEPEGQARGGHAARTIALTLSHPDLGPMDASARWLDGTAGGDLQVRFAVRDEPSAASLTQAVDELAARLRAVGFRHVSVAVAVDPEAGVLRGGRPDDPPPPGGSIVSALA